MGRHNKHIHFPHQFRPGKRQWRIYWKLNRLFLELGLSYERLTPENKDKEVKQG